MRYPYFALRDGTGSRNFVRAILNVRAKCPRVNSVFLVQLRKNTAANRRGFSPVGEPGPGVARRRDGESFAMRPRSRQKSARVGAAISTEGAQEMQKGSSGVFRTGGRTMRKFAGASLILFLSTAVGFGQAAAGASHIALRCGWLFDGRGDALRANV